MAELRFEWDPGKDKANQRKHGVSFAEARTVFFDEQAVLISDPDEDEDRFVLVGLSAALRTLVVCHCYRDQDEVIRLISAAGKQVRTARLREAMETMRKSYDFSKGRKNPYAKRLKKQITIRLDEETLEYFRELSDETEIPYQTLINLYLGECARTKKRPSMRWKPNAA